MENQDLTTATRLREYIAFMLPWAHGHQRTALGDSVAALIEHQTACQAHLARYCGQPEAAVKRRARVLHTERLAPRLGAEAVLFQAIQQRPRHGTVRWAMAWTSADNPHCLVVARSVGRRAVPMYGRAYEAGVLKGRRQRYALAVRRRAVGRVRQAGGNRRVMVPAARGCADGALCSWLHEWGMAFIMRVHAGPHVYVQGQWRQWGQRKLRRHERHRSLGALPDWERCPQALWGSKRRARDRHGNWGSGPVVAQRP